MNCPHCNSPARDDWPCEFGCKSVNLSGRITRSPVCYEDEIAQLKAKVWRLEEAGDKLAERHLLVPTTYPQAQAHVADYHKEKGQP
jgi:hypothetical protein